MIQKEIRLVGLHQLSQNLKETPLLLMLFALLATTFNFLFLSFYDKLGMSYLKKKISFFKLFKISASSFAISNLAGHTYASGGAVRYLLLKALGFKQKEIFVLVAFISLCVFLGLLATFILTCLIKTLFQVNIHLNTPYLIETGFWGGLFLFCIYFKEIVLKKRFIILKKTKIKAPNIKQTFLSILTGFGDFFTLFLVFYLVLQNKNDFSFLEVFISFSLASFGAYLSQVPAGIGVFETLFLIFLPHTLPQKENILTAFILFRLFYYIIPFIIFGSYLSIKKIFLTKNK